MVAEPIYSLIVTDSVSAQLPFLLQVLQNRLPTNYMFNKIQYLLDTCSTYHLYVQQNMIPATSFAKSTTYYMFY